MLLKIGDRLTFEDAKNYFRKDLVKFNVAKVNGEALVESVEFDEKDKDNIVNRETIANIEQKHSAAGMLQREKTITIGEKNLWYLVGETDYIFINDNSVERSIDKYFQNLAIVNEKSDPNLPEGVRKRFARAVSRYKMPLHLVTGFGLKEDSVAHAAYLINENKITIVPEYFIRMGVVKIGTEWIDEFSKTVVHEFGHVVWHQILNEKQQLEYEQLAPKFMDDEQRNQNLLTGHSESEYTKGYTDTLSGKRVFGEYWSHKNDKFLSPYARMSIKEDFAEAFLYYNLAPDFLMGFDEKRYNFIKSIVIPSSVIQKGDLVLDGNSEPVQISDLLTIDLQTSELRRRLALEFEGALHGMLKSNNIGIEQIKNIIPYDEYVQVGNTLPTSLKVVSYVEKMTGDKNLIQGNIEISLFDEQEKADKIIYNKRVGEEDTKNENVASPDEMKLFYDKCEQLDVDVSGDDIRINKNYYKKDEIDHWVTTPSGKHIPIPKAGARGYKKGSAAPDKGKKALVAIEQGKEKPPTKKEISRRKAELPLGHIESKVGRIPYPRKFTPIESSYSVQRHFSEKAPDHHDLRLKMGNKAYSWAIPVWPNRGERQLAVLQPVHSVKYMGFRGIIPKGEYGAGRVDLMDHRKVDITDWGKKKIAFNVLSGKNEGRYALINIGDNNYLIVRKKQIRDYPEKEYMPARARLKFKESMWDDPKFVLQPKMDGARYLLYVGGKNGNQLLSRSFSAKHEGHHVDQTDNVPHIRDIDFEQKQMVLDGEIFRGNRFVTNAMMNSSPMRSRELQNKHGKAIYYVFDILKYENNDLTKMPYSMRLKFLERAIGDNKYPNIKIIPTFKKNKKKTYSRLVRMGYEGVVLKNIHGKYDDRFQTKMKPVQDADYVIMGNTPGKGKYEGMFGALILGQYKNGKLVRVGKVGSGFGEKERLAISKKLKTLIKQKKVIEIKHLGFSPNGVPQAPVFSRIREDKSWHDLYNN